MRARGFTLIEVVLVIVIIGILAAFIAPVLTTALTAYDSVSKAVDVLTTSRYAMERMAREIRTIRRDPVNSANYDIATGSMTASKFEFCRPDGTRVTLNYNSGLSDLGLAYTAGFTSTCTTSAVTTQTLADAVTAFTFTYRTIGGGVAAGKNDVAYVDVAMTITGAGTTGAYGSNVRIDLRHP